MTLEPLDRGLQELLAAEQSRSEGDLSKERSLVKSAVMTAIAITPTPTDGSPPEGGSPADGGPPPPAPASGPGGGAATAGSAATAGAASTAGLGGALLAKPIVLGLIGLAVGAGGGSAITAAVMSRDDGHGISIEEPIETDRDETAVVNPPRSEPALAPPEKQALSMEDVSPSPEEQEVRPATPTSPARSTKSPVRDPSPAGSTTLGAERVILERARTALARRRPQDALLALMEHERRFPNGAMREERDGLVVRALAASGRRKQARQRADRFRQDHPGSMLTPIVEDAVTTEGESTQ